MFLLSLSAAFKIKRRCKRLIELARMGLEREKRPLHNFNFEHFTSLFHRGGQRKLEKRERYRNGFFSLNCQIYNVVVTIVIAKAPPYYPLLCVAC